MKKLLLLFLMLPALLQAADEDPQAAINAKLREGLRNTMIQLRDAQTQVATLTATQAESDAKVKDLTAKLEALTKKAADDQATANQEIAKLKAEGEARDTRNAQQIEALGKWKAAYNKLVEQAKAIDAKRATLVTEKIQLTRKVEEQQRKNAALYTLAEEILHRYEHYGLGDAIAAREPFTGIAKVKLENYVQEKSDALLDQKIKN